MNDISGDEQAVMEQLLSMKSSELYAWIIEHRAQLRLLQIAEMQRTVGQLQSARDRAMQHALQGQIAFLDAMTLRIGRGMQAREMRITAKLEAPEMEIEDLGDEDPTEMKTLELVTIQKSDLRLRKEGQMRW